MKESSPKRNPGSELSPPSLAPIKMPNIKRALARAAILKSQVWKEKKEEEKGRIKRIAEEGRSASRAGE